MKDHKPLMTLGLMGGSMQAQGHMQVLVDLIDLGANLQAASDAARFNHHDGDNSLGLETQLYNLVGAQLQALGHNPFQETGDEMGGYQAILFTPGAGDPEEYDRGNDRTNPLNGYYQAGSDHRRDGQAVGW
jgi:gamma-glutamyltranspeptidase / glutathione hydrolase